MGFWPLYRDTLLQGPSHVSFSLPGKPSEISKIVGGTSPAIFLVPNIDYLSAFIEGNIGIADNIQRESLFKNFNSPVASSNEMVFRQFAKVNNIEIDDINKYKKDGKFKIPKSEIKLSPNNDTLGLKAIEKTVLTSIFETQKPYLEVAKLVLEVIAKSEDIVARIMPLLAINPAKAKSEKPISNAGNANRTKAIGYQKGVEMKKSLDKLDKISKSGGKTSIDKDGKVTKDKINSNQNSEIGASSVNDKWEIISAVYSTGVFDNKIDYLYTYIDLPSDSKEAQVDNTSDIDTYDSYKPKKIILGIFKSDGTPLNPYEKLKIGLDDAKFGAADWIIKSPKWKFIDKYIWPSLGDPYYMWKKGSLREESKLSPGSGWSIMKYKKDEKNKLTNEISIENDPIITKFDSNDLLDVKKYFIDYTNMKMDMTDLESSDKKEALSNILSNLNIESHLQNIKLYGQATSVYKEDVPKLLKKTFKPFQIYSGEAEKDLKLKAYQLKNGQKAGMIWIDPESDYDTKIIRVDPFIYDPSIDANKLNENLSTNNLYSKAKYGTGDDESPQEIEVIKRYALTPLDIESYYIIEGVLVDDNAQNGASGSPTTDTQWYKLSHAIGATTIFIKLLIDIFSKLIPNIKKLMKLFTSPSGFVSDVIMDKIGENFSFLSKDSKEKLGNVSKIKESKESSPKKSDYVNKMKSNFTNSQLSNLIFVEHLKGKEGNIKSIIDGQATIAFSIFGKDLSFGMEMLLSNITLDSPKLPIKLTFNKELNSKSKDLQNSTQSNSDNNKSNLEYLSDLDKINNNTKGLTKSDNPNDYYIVSTKYSTGSFISGVDYNYIYITQDEENVLKEVDDLEKLGEENDLALAKEKLEDIIKSDPDNEKLNDKLREIIKKLGDKNSSTQPILKFLLGLITLPIKIIGGIIEWLMNFFKSLANPMALPAKIAELLSFKWIMDFFSPKGILEMAGIKFNPDLVKEWVEKSKMPNPNKNKFAKKAKYTKDTIPEHGGDYLFPDDYPIADLSEFLNVAFLVGLPTYTTKSIRENPKFPFTIYDPILCFIEKLINSIIDFIWSTLGLEALIPPPHIKLCDDSENSDNTNKILNGEIPKGDGSTEVINTEPFKSKTSDTFLYEVNLPNGEVKTFLDRISLDKFIEENRNFGYDFQF